MAPTPPAILIWFLEMDGPSKAVVIAAIVSGCFALAARWAPKTAPEAARDSAEAQAKLAEAHLAEVDGWEKLRNAHMEEIARLCERVEQLEEDLGTERDECDRRMAELKADSDRKIGALEARLQALSREAGMRLRDGWRE